MGDGIEKKPHEQIAELAGELRGLSDEELLAELRRLPALPDDGAVDWGREETWRTAYRYVAFADVAAERRLRPAVLPLLERASYGDPGDPTTLPVLLAALRDPAVEVRRCACTALEMLCQTNPHLRERALEALASCGADPAIAADARGAAEAISAGR